MDSKLIRTIIADQKICYFISPHFDDVVLSAGALAAELAKTNKVVVINIFTSAGKPPYTLSAKSFLKQCDYPDAERLYDDRAREDVVALQGITSDIHNLNYTEALWRTKPGRIVGLLGKFVPELKMVYPTYRFHIIKGKITKQDHIICDSITDDLRHLTKAKNKAIFCPSAIGNHIDHVITKQVCEALFDQIIEWTDYPYSAHESDRQTKEGIQMFNFEAGINEKKQRISHYKTQFKAMFGAQMPMLSAEQYSIIDKTHKE
jgi:LmbE family N-acetylglucosaminyl deacetylase